MKARPTIFISGVSHEFGVFRDAIENEIEMKGCFAENQPGFSPDYRTVEEMLRRRLHDSDAVIHLAGFRFGAEPNHRPTDALRRSYTQMELDIAREMQKPVYVFLSTDASVRQPAKPDEQAEDAEAIALQQAHRQAIQNTNQLYYFFKDQAELCKLVAEIPPVQAAGFKADISRIIKYAPAELIGRTAETALLNDAWEKAQRQAKPRPHVMTFVALGGEGKTSLVAKWAAELAANDWPGCDAVFAWSFYSQGTREQNAASSDLFLAEALKFFGDEAMANSAAGAFDKGRRLAELVGAQRALLILDGVEPLQYAPTSPLAGELKDQGLAALLKGLASQNRGLCVATTRYALPDLRAYWQTTAPSHDLPRLARAAGVRLLQTIGVKGSLRQNLPSDDGREQWNEFEKLVEDVNGHALTLQIIGQFLVRAHQGDIRRRDRFKLEKADAKIQGGHAFRAMDSYVKWMEDDSDEARRELAILQLLGLFDRPASADCFAALLQPPAIPNLTEPLVGLPDEDLQFSLTALRDAKLITLQGESAFTWHAIDAHPLLREYFAARVRSSGFSRSGAEAPPEGGTTYSPWQAAHRRLYEHLCATTKDKDEPTLDDLQPLYQAVAHGCQAGLQQEAYDEVCQPRIWRQNDIYTVRKLGAFGSDLGAVASFYEQPWSRLSTSLAEADQAFIHNCAAFILRALGRLTEALEPMRVSGEMDVKAKEWDGAARSYSNLSELELTLGEVAGAVGDAEQSVRYADRSGDAEWQCFVHTTHADALHQAGRRAEAEARFLEAEQMQAERQPAYPLLFSIWGFRYCDLLLAEAERAAWGNAECGVRNTELIAACRAVSERAAQTLRLVESWQRDILSAALDQLTLGRAALYTAMLEPSASKDSALHIPHSAINEAVSGLRRAGQQDILPLGLLTRAWLRHLTGASTGPDSAQSDLDEAWDIAARGGMRLFQADIHLYRARLFGGMRDEGGGMRAEPYPWESPQHDLAEAERLINECGYHRRDAELADAKRMILGQH